MAADEDGASTAATERWSVRSAWRLTRLVRRRRQLSAGVLEWRLPDDLPATGCQWARQHDVPKRSVSESWALGRLRHHEAPQLELKRAMVDVVAVATDVNEVDQGKTEKEERKLA